MSNSTFKLGGGVNKSLVDLHTWHFLTILKLCHKPCRYINNVIFFIYKAIILLLV